MLGPHSARGPDFGHVWVIGWKEFLEIKKNHYPTKDA